MRRTFGILGHPIAHSRSPAMQGAAFAAVGIDAEYVPFDVRPEDLAEAVAGLRRLGVAGLNVTVPHKRTVMPLLDEVSDEAQALGAVNTIVVDGGRWRGENTDARGLARAIAAMGVGVRGAKAVVLGAGGAGRAAVAALASLGARHVHVANRTPARAREIAAACTTSVSDLDRESLVAVLGDAAILVQATSAGMDGIEAPGWPDAIPLEAMPAGSAVVDLVYAPRPTVLLARASARGLAVADGLEMLLWQGALAFERWTGKAAPIDAMRRAIEGA